jgi:hypothetical protein
MGWKKFTNQDQMDNIQAEVIEIEEHLHNREKWIGNNGGDPQEDNLTSFQVASGNGIFGTEVLLLDTGDTPFRTGKTFFDFHRLLITDLSEFETIYLRVIWGTGTVAEAEAAGQYTTVSVLRLSTLPTAGGFPMDIICPRIAVGTKVWIKMKATTNLSTCDFVFGLHEYDE